MSRKYDGTVARIAGNIMSGFAGNPGARPIKADVPLAVELARLIVAEVQRTEPPPPQCIRCYGTGKLQLPTRGGVFDCPDCGGVQR